MFGLKMSCFKQAASKQNQLDYKLGKSGYVLSKLWTPQCKWFLFSSMQYERTKLWQINKSTYVSNFFFLIKKRRRRHFLALNSEDTGSALFRVQKYRLLFFKEYFLSVFTMCFIFIYNDHGSSLKHSKLPPLYVN